MEENMSEQNGSFGKQPKHPHDSKESPEHENVQGASQDLELDQAAGLEKALEQAQEQAAEFKDRYMRGAAEMENLKKRFERERSDLLQYGAEKILSDLLNILDSFARAFPKEQEVGSAEGLTAMRAGMELVQKQFLDVLQKHGVTQVETQNAKFDPRYHQAIQRIESSEVSDEMIKEVFAQGYLLHQRLLRPAIVSVLVPATDRKDS